MIRIENIEYLYGLILIPIFILIYLLMRYSRARRLKKYGDLSLIANLFPEVSAIKPAVKFSILMAGLLFLILGMANPQIGTKLDEAKREGVDVIIALDVSNSMKAEDIKPSRLERAKAAISKLLDKLINDRIGLIVFAGDAYLQLPLTTDYSAAKLFLSVIDVDIVPLQGTAIGSAIQLAIKSFNVEEKKHKVLIIITDGENHEDDAISAAEEAAKQGVVLHTIGIGSLAGAPIPVYSNGVKTGYRNDNEGNAIVTKLDPALLQQIANAGNGEFTHSTTGDIDLAGILDKIAGMEKKEYKSKLFTDYVDWFQYFIATALFFIVVEIFISEKKNKIISSWNLFGERKK